MKRIFLLISLYLTGFVCMNAQNVTFTNPEIEVVFKRCICSGPSAYIDLVMTNYSGKEMTGSSIASENMADYASYYTAAYDDEGNVYKPGSGMASVRIGDDNFVPSLAQRAFALPSEVPVKVRVYLKNVDEFAAEITLLKMNFRGLDPSTPYGVSLLEVRNIPIMRQ